MNRTRVSLKVPSRMCAWPCGVLCAAIILGYGTRSAVAATRSHPDSIVTERLGTLPPEFSDRFITGLEGVRDPSGHVQARPRLYLSSDGLHMAFVLDQITSRSMIVDGVRGGAYGFISRGVFSAEGGHFAYLAGPSEKAGPTLVFDGREIVLGVYVSGSLSLSGNGRHWAFAGRARRERTQPNFVVTDRGSGSPYDSIGAISLSWDGSRVGYVAHSWDRSVVVIDGVASPILGEVTPLIFDLSGRHVAYTCHVGESWYVVRDGKKSEPYAALDVTSVRFSADGTRLAYVARIGQNQTLFVDGEAGELWPIVVADSSCFSRDGKHILHWAGRGSRDWIPVRDGKQLGNRDTECPGTLAISADGAHVAYAECVALNGAWHVVNDGIAGPECEAVGVLRFSADGRRLAYVARRGNFEMAVVDGVMGPEFTAVGDPIFSVDGKHEAHLAWIANDRAQVVLDGEGGPEFDWISPMGPTFLPDGRLMYLAVRNSDLVRISQAPRAGR